jgi:tetratricopeptide (TPR) repeat protein
MFPIQTLSRVVAAVALAAFAAAGAPVARGDGAAAALAASKRAYDASDYEKSVETLRPIAAGEPDNAEVQFWLLRNYYELHQWDQAISAGERAVAIAPNSSAYHMWLGRSFGSKAEHVGNPFSAFSLAKKSRKEFETAMTLDPRNFTAIQDLIEFYCAAPGIVGGGEDKALRVINDLMNVDEGEARFGRANCFRQKKNFDQADAEFDRAIAAGLKRTETIYEIGDYAAKHNQPERMLKVAKVGEAVNRADPRAEFYRGAALVLKSERVGEAERLLKSYLKKAPVRTAYPSHAWAHAFLGRLHEQQGKCDAATAEYREALRTDAKNKEAREALKRLAKQCQP